MAQAFRAYKRLGLLTEVNLPTISFIHFAKGVVVLVVLLAAGQVDDIGVVAEEDDDGGVFIGDHLALFLFMDVVDVAQSLFSRFAFEFAFRASELNDLFNLNRSGVFFTFNFIFAAAAVVVVGGGDFAIIGGNVGHAVVVVDVVVGVNVSLTLVFRQTMIEVGFKVALFTFEFE